MSHAEHIARLDTLLNRACRETGIDYAHAFASTPSGKPRKDQGRTRLRWRIWRQMRMYGMSYDHIGQATGVHHTSVLHAAQVEGWART